MNSLPRIVIVGAGGHGHVVLDILRRRAGVEVVGFLDDADELEGTKTRGGLEVVGRADLQSLRECEADGFVVAVGGNAVRRMLFERCAAAGLTPWRAIHPETTIAGSVELGEGVQVVAGVIVNAHATVGDDVILNTGCTVDHDNVIADHSFIAPGVHLGGDVHIGEGAFIGIGASILPGVSIGDGATVGGGAVVIEDVAPEAVVAGVPARMLRARKPGS